MPNKNSYLAACFDEATRSALNELQDALEEHLQSEGYSFDRMSLQELHLTFLFAGERLRQLSGEQLRTWHNDVTVAIRQSGLGCSGSAAPALRRPTSPTHEHRKYMRRMSSITERAIS